MEYKDLMQRYWQAQTTAAEEQELREQLLQNTTPTTEERAARARMMHAAAPQPGVRVKLHQPASRIWQMALATGLCALAIGVTIMLKQPTVYGYYNGEPITSLEEAQYHADKIFANLAQAEIPTEEELINKLFRLE